MSKQHSLCAAFVETLACVIQHPATPARLAQAFKRDLAPVAARLAGVPLAVFDTPRPVVKMDARTLFLTFGLQAADVMDNDALDGGDFDELSECANEIEALLKPENGREAEAGRLRGTVREFGRIHGLTTAGAQLPKARRASVHTSAQRVGKRGKLTTGKRPAFSPYV